MIERSVGAFSQTIRCLHFNGMTTVVNRTCLSTPGSLQIIVSAHSSEIICNLLTKDNDGEGAEKDVGDDENKHSCEVRRPRGQPRTKRTRPSPMSPFFLSTPPPSCPLYTVLSNTYIAIVVVVQVI